mgnify:CR=1 FL=1
MDLTLLVHCSFHHVLRRLGMVSSNQCFLMLQECWGEAKVELMNCWPWIGIYRSMMNLEFRVSIVMLAHIHLLKRLSH